MIGRQVFVTVLLLVSCPLSLSSPITFFPPPGVGVSQVVHAEPQVVISDQLAHEFFADGHPAGGFFHNSFNPLSSNSIAFDDDAENFEEARHAARFGLELDRLEKRNKELYDEYIASSYLSRSSKTLPLPHSIKQLASSHPSFGGRVPSFGGGLSSFENTHDFPTAHQATSFSYNSFPTLYQGPTIKDPHLLLTDRRRNGGGKFLFPPKEGSRLVTKQTFPDFGYY